MITVCPAVSTNAATRLAFPPGRSQTYMATRLLPFRSSQSTANRRTATDWLAGDLMPGWRIVKPLALTVAEDHPGWFIAHSAHLTEYGEGPSAAAAVEDFKAVLVESYEFWADARNADARNAADEIALLREYVCRAAVAPTHAAA